MDGRGDRNSASSFLAGSLQTIMAFIWTHTAMHLWRRTPHDHSIATNALSAFGFIWPVITLGMWAFNAPVIFPALGCCFFLASGLEYMYRVR